MGLWQPFGVGSTASRPKSRGSVFKHEFLGILSTWHGILCFILLNIIYPDRLVLGFLHSIYRLATSPHRPHVLATEELPPQPAYFLHEVSQTHKIFMANFI